MQITLGVVGVVPGCSDRMTSRVTSASLSNSGLRVGITAAHDEAPRGRTNHISAIPRPKTFRVSIGNHSSTQVFDVGAGTPVIRGSLEIFAVSRNIEVDLLTHTEIKPTISTGDTTTPDELVEPDAPVEIFETFAITGTVVLTGLTGLTVFTFLAGTVVLVALLGITDTAATATFNDLGATPLVAFATDTLDETHDVKNKTKSNNRLTTTPRPIDLNS